MYDCVAGQLLALAQRRRSAEAERRRSGGETEASFSSKRAGERREACDLWRQGTLRGGLEGLRKRNLVLHCGGHLAWQAQHFATGRAAAFVAGAGRVYDCVAVTVFCWLRVLLTETELLRT